MQNLKSVLVKIGNLMYPVFPLTAGILAFFAVNCYRNLKSGRQFRDKTLILMQNSQAGPNCIHGMWQGLFRTVSSDAETACGTGIAAGLKEMSQSETELAGRGLLKDAGWRPIQWDFF